MNLFRLTGCAALVLAFTITCAAQSAQCTLKPSQAPPVRGLRLGMTTSELKEKYPGFTSGRANEFGQSKVILDKTYLEGADAVAFKGVDNITLNFVDDRLVEFRVSYDPLPWRDLSQFVEKISESLKLPDAWRGSEDMQTLDCSGFQVKAGRYSYSVDTTSAYIWFKAPGAEEIIRERVEKKKAQQIQSFKP